MPIVEFEGQTFEVDEDGFLIDFAAWNQAWVRYVTSAEGIKELTEDHWSIIRLLQDYYTKNGNAPRITVLTQGTGFKLKYIYDLFPSGPGKGACRMAGLPKPAGCV
jgi:dissimilatory sulfite reductase related protein